MKVARRRLTILEWPTLGNNMVIEFHDLGDGASPSTSHVCDLAAAIEVGLNVDTRVEEHRVYRRREWVEV